MLNELSTAYCQVVHCSTKSYRKVHSVWPDGSNMIITIVTSVCNGHVTLNYTMCFMRLLYALHCCNRNNARVVFAGSLAMFSNEYFEAEGYGNEAFCIELSRSVLHCMQYTHGTT
jgi:hypothetical protein